MTSQKSFVIVFLYILLEIAGGHCVLSAEERRNLYWCFVWYLDFGISFFCNIWGL